MPCWKAYGYGLTSVSIMEELDIASVAKRSIKGIFALVSRTFFVQIISFASNFLLTIFLSPAIFGAYFVVSAVLAFLTYFSDIGLAAALIQKKEPIQDIELRTVFTIQQMLVVTIVILALVFSRIIGDFYRFNASGVLLFQALVVAFFLSSLKTIPSIILERALKFERLVIPEIVETLVFSVVVVVLAIKGFGILSFTYAVLLRGLVGVIAIYIICPWKIGFSFSKSTASKLLSFGIPFQTNSFLALFKDDLVIAYLGKVLPIAQVGFIGFAQKWAFAPLTLIMNNIIKITFPSFSRLQHDKDILSKALEKSIFASVFFIFPATVGMIILPHFFLNVIPKYAKWDPALLLLALFAINASLSSISTPLTNALSAIGKIKVSLYFMIFWTIATWIFTPLLVMLMGFNGVGIASAVIALSVFIVVKITKRYIPFGILKVIYSPLICAVAMGVVLLLISLIIPKTILFLFVTIAGGAVVYFAFMFLIAKKTILSDLAFIRKNLAK